MPTIDQRTAIEREFEKGVEAKFRDLKLSLQSKQAEITQLERTLKDQETKVKELEEKNLQFLAKDSKPELPEIEVLCKAFAEEYYIELRDEYCEDRSNEEPYPRGN